MGLYLIAIVIVQIMPGFFLTANQTFLIELTPFIQAYIRILIKIVLGIISFFSIPFTKNKRALHDFAAARLRSFTAPDRSWALQPNPLLRTVRDSFPSHGSSPSKVSLVVIPAPRALKASR